MSGLLETWIKAEKFYGAILSPSNSVVKENAAILQKLQNCSVDYKTFQTFTSAQAE